MEQKGVPNLSKRPIFKAEISAKTMDDVQTIEGRLGIQSHEEFLEVSCTILMDSLDKIPFSKRVGERAFGWLERKAGIPKLIETPPKELDVLDRFLQKFFTGLSIMGGEDMDEIRKIRKKNEVKPNG